MKPSSCVASAATPSFHPMTTPPQLASHQCVGLGRRALQQLRATLERDSGIQAASYLQEAGFAGGEQLYAAYADWLASGYRVDRPGALDAAHLGEVLSSFFTESGWGAMSVTPLPSWHSIPPTGRRPATRAVPTIRRATSRADCWPTSSAGCRTGWSR